MGSRSAAAIATTPRASGTKDAPLQHAVHRLQTENVLLSLSDDE
jgi:hypothetical protein